MEVLTWSIASHIKNRRPSKAPLGYRVAFITTFVPGSESISLLKRTLPAMVRANYAHDTWILDEGNDPDVKALCKKYGVKHFSRHGLDKYNQDSGKFTRKTKAGNHNAWHDVHGAKYDFVAQIDTDFIPRKNFLTATLGYFNDPKVAFVGTPQIYGNENKSIIAKGAAQQTYGFYGAILRGMDGMKTTMLIGANHVIRAKAFEDVSHYSAHITEDLLTGMKLHAAGWESVYVPKALAIGEGPSTWKAYFDQQKRWAYGCMNILFAHSPRLFRKMSLRRKTYYFLLQQHYFSGLAMGLSALSLGLYFGLGITTAKLDLGWFLSFYIPALLIVWVMNIRLQKFNVRPNRERGIMWAAAYVNLAVWPVFLMAFLGLFKRRKMTYKVTPKGKPTLARQKPTFKLFTPHIVIGLVSILGIISISLTHRDSALMIFWASLSTIIALLVPIIIPVLRYIKNVFEILAAFAGRINRHYKILEFSTRDHGLLPTPPSLKEKYLYSKRGVNYLLGFSAISFVGINFSLFRFILAHPIVWPLFLILFLTGIYYLISLVVNTFTKDFDVEKHKKMVRNWRPKSFPSVDVFLPTAGESIDVLRNTWNGVRAMSKNYNGEVVVYVLDDADSKDVKILANKFSFQYEVRSNRGYFKKAGNLRNGFKISKNEFIVIFDADFVPRKDFLKELLPYFNDKKIGIVQSPQYFEVSQRQNWLERGAGAVQELFYRFSQVSRQSHDASICVGSNAIYRRAALNDTGGTALIEHSEDVHTGFNLRMHGWTIQYVPILLAKGLCPSSMQAFFKQQYRWCMGSLSLLASEKFWNTKLKIRTRLSYMSGFLYYIHTGITSFYAPIVPIMLLLLPSQIHLLNYIFILPAFLFAQVIYPIWHKSTYGLEAWATRQVYGWAHAFAIWDKITNKQMGWTPTGTKIHKDTRYTTFRILQFSFNFLPAVLWVSLGGWFMFTSSFLEYLPITISGIYYLAISSKVTLYMTKDVKMAATITGLAQSDSSLTSTI